MDGPNIFSIKSTTYSWSWVLLFLKKMFEFRPKIYGMLWLYGPMSSSKLYGILLIWIFFNIKRLCRLPLIFFLNFLFHFFLNSFKKLIKGFKFLPLDKLFFAKHFFSWIIFLCKRCFENSNSKIKKKNRKDFFYLKTFLLCKSLQNVVRVFQKMILLKLFFCNFWLVKPNLLINRASQKMTLFPAAWIFLRLDLKHFEQCLTLILDMFLFLVCQHIQIETLNI